MIGDSEDECNENWLKISDGQGRLNYCTVNGFVKYCEPCVCVS